MQMHASLIARHKCCCARRVGISSGVYLFQGPLDLYWKEQARRQKEQRGGFEGRTNEPNEPR